MTKTADLAKVQVRVDDTSRRYWLRISELAGLTEPFCEDEMARLSELVDTRKSLESHKLKKVKVDELGKYVWKVLQNEPLRPVFTQENKHRI